MNPRLKKIVILGTVAAAAALLIAFLIVRGGRRFESPLAAIPEDAFLVTVVDVRALGASRLAEVVLGKGDGRGKLPGVDLLTESCGGNPLLRLRAIAAAVPEGGDQGDFGIAATCDMTEAELTTCAEKLIARRGGSPETSRVGTFTVVSDARAGAANDAPPKVAFRDGGLILVGRGAWLTRMMDTAEKRAPSVETNVAHASLRRALASREPRALALVATVLLPKALRDRLKREMEGEDTHEGHPASAMDGVLGVASAGLALYAGTSAAGDDSVLLAELRCESDAACLEVKTLLEKTRFGWSRDLGVRLVGLGPLLDHFRIDANGASLAVRTQANAPDLAHALDRVLEHATRPAERGSDARGKSPSMPGPTSTRMAEEVVPARSGDASALSPRGASLPYSAPVEPPEARPLPRAGDGGGAASGDGAKTPR